MNTTLFAELFGGKGRLRALRILYANAGRAFALRELSTEARVESGNLHRLLQRWLAVGLARKVPLGRNAFGYQASRDPALAFLGTLFKKESELVADIAKELSPGTVYAGIFGSYARGEEGANSDIDLLVLCGLSEIKVNAALKPVGRKHNRALHATVMSPERFKALVAESNSFAREVLSGPRIDVKGTASTRARSSLTKMKSPTR